jgi:glycosyltransferase involved in cell wall biosynthesis
MKVLHINTWNTGGAAKACLRLHQGLLDLGVYSDVLVKSKTEEDVSNVHEVWDALNVVQKAKKLVQEKLLEAKHQKQLNEFPAQSELFSFCDSNWDLTADPRYQAADVIHLHWVAGLLDYTSFFAKNTKPLVWTLHDFAPFSGGFHYPFAVDHLSFSELAGAQLEQKRAAIVGKRMHVVAPSQYLSNVASNSELMRHAKHSVIANGTNSSAYQHQSRKDARAELGLEPDAQVLLFVADLIDYKRKGFSVLMEALNDPDFEKTTLAVVGKLDPNLVNNRANVVAFGRVVDEEKLNKIYAAADLFVIPSLADNLPNTVAEALCSGTPVVGFHVGGIPEMIPDDTFGVLSETIDVDGLANAIKTAFSMRFDRKKLGLAAADMFSQKLAAQRYSEVYRSIQ